MRPDPEKAKEEQGEEAMDRKLSLLYIRVRTPLQRVAPLFAFFSTLLRACHRFSPPPTRVTDVSIRTASPAEFF
jgi:hypothetical protein